MKTGFGFKQLDDLPGRIRTVEASQDARSPPRTVETIRNSDAAPSMGSSFTMLEG